MRRAALAVAASALLVGPTVLAFHAGGYFDGPRLVATLAARCLVLVAAVCSPQLLPAGWPGRVALAGLGLITIWTAVSLSWAPLAAAATDNLVRTLLYLGTLLAAIALLREPRAARAVEPVLALGAFVAIAYGLLGRLLPGLIDHLASTKGGGRLEQPITYWNAEGLLASMGLVLCVRLVGDGSRPVAMRAGAGAAGSLLGLGLYLTYSRGAIVAAVVGLVVLLAAVPTRPHLRALGIVLGGTAVLVVSSVLLPAVGSAEGALAERERDGLIMLVLVTATALAALALSAWSARAEREGRLGTGAFRGAGRLPLVAVATLAICLAALVASGLAEKDEPSEGRGPVRLTSADSRRYDYWRVAADALGQDPLRGAGSGAFRVIWLRERPVAEGALEVHSLPLEMVLELGLPGLAGFALMVAGLLAAGARALRRRPLLAAGPAAACIAWFIHASIDWDWQVPTVTLTALILAGALVAAGEGRSARARRGRTVVARPRERQPSEWAAA